MVIVSILLCYAVGNHRDLKSSAQTVLSANPNQHAYRYGSFKKVLTSHKGSQSKTNGLRPVIFMHGIFNKVYEPVFAAKYIPEVSD